MAGEIQTTTDSSAMEAQLKWMGFTESKAGSGVWRNNHGGITYCVNFVKGDIFKFVDGENISEDPEDEYLNNLLAIASSGPAKPAKKEMTLGTKEQFIEAGLIEDDRPQQAVSVVDTGLPSLSKADIVRPAVNAQAALQAWNEFQALKTNILSKSDLHRIQGKDFVKKSGWRKFATFYNLTDRIVEEKRITCEDGAFIWKVKVECTAPNARITEGVAMCSSKEKSGARIEHDTYSTAHTRAKNRAISDMIAAGEVSAEEMA